MQCSAFIFMSLFDVNPEGGFHWKLHSLAPRGADLIDLEMFQELGL